MSASSEFTAKKNHTPSQDITVKFGIDYQHLTQFYSTDASKKLDEDEKHNISKLVNNYVTNQGPFCKSMFESAAGYQQRMETTKNSIFFNEIEKILISSRQESITRLTYQGYIKAACYYAIDELCNIFLAATSALVLLSLFGLGPVSLGFSGLLFGMSLLVRENFSNFADLARKTLEETDEKCQQLEDKRQVGLEANRQLNSFFRLESSTGSKTTEPYCSQSFLTPA